MSSAASSRRAGSRDWRLEHDNLRAALTELEVRGESELLLRLTVSLFRFWYVRGHLIEGRRRLEHGSRLTPTVPRRCCIVAP